MRKFHACLLSAVALTFAACSGQMPGPAPAPQTQAQRLISYYQAKGTPLTIIDVGGGVKTGAAFAVDIKFNEPFATKASASGTPRKQAGDVANFEVYLLEAAAGAAPTGNVSSLVKFGPSTITASLVGGQRTILFQNVKESTGANEYYVGVRALDSGSANITNLGAPANLGAAASRLYVSTTGGAGNTGGVNVGAPPTYTVSNVNQLQIALTLLDSVGASIDSRVTVTDGAVNAPGGVSVN